MRGRPRASLWAFALAVAAGVAVVGLAWWTDDDDVRWWLVELPVVFTAVPLAFPRQRVRVATAAVLAVFCVVTGMSVGMLFVPALLATFASCVTPEYLGSPR